MTESCNQYSAFEAILKMAFPGVFVYQANMPFSKMDELTKVSAKTVTYLFYQDRQRVTSTGPSGVHDVLIEVNIFADLAEADAMINALNEILLADDVTVSRWTFSLVVAEKKDIWEPQIKSKRIWTQYKGIMIEEDT